MSTHPLWRPFDPIETLARRRLRINRRQIHVDGVVPFDEDWARQFDRIRQLLIEALSQRAIRITHVGSTAIPGLSAKPIIDVDLIVEDSSDEDSYLPELNASGFLLLAREPAWEEHRFLTYADPNANVHVFSEGATEPMRHLMFRDWLMRNPRDRDAYAALKSSLAGSGFEPAGDYNGSKAELVYDIYEHAFSADSRFHHEPQPRS